MTPWPADLLRDYPLNTYDNRHPERPWWCEHSGYWTRYSRGDATQYQLQQRTRSSSTLAEFRADAQRCLAEMAAFDARDPIPHPGFRAGQVWAAVSPADTRVYTIALHEPRPLPEASTFLVHTRTSMRWWEAKPMNAEKLTGLLSHDGCYPYFLIVDPCCPWLAPWASSQKESVSP